MGQIFAWLLRCFGLATAWLHQNETWENMDSERPEEIDGGESLDSKEGRFF